MISNFYFVSFYILHIHNFITPLREVLIFYHTDSVITPCLGHGPYLSEGVASDVILEDSVKKIFTIKTTLKYIDYYYFSCKDAALHPALQVIVYLSVSLS